MGIAIGYVRRSVAVVPAAVYDFRSVQSQPGGR